MSEGQKITVDIGAAMEALKANPELAEQMNALVLGDVAAAELADAHAKNAMLIEALRPCVEFARWALTDGSFQGHNLDGGEIQDKALALGLISETQFDPTVHGEHPDFEKGERYYVFAGPLQDDE